MTEKLNEQQMRDILIDLIGVEYGARKKVADEIGINSSEMLGALGGHRPPPARLLAWAGYKRVIEPVYYERMSISKGENK